MDAKTRIGKTMTTELDEQLRLNSMGSEREYILLGKLERLTQDRDRLEAANKILQDWFDGLKLKHDAIEAGLAKAKHHYEHYLNEWSEVCNENQILINERDANAKNAARYRFITSNIVDDGDMNVLEEAFGDLAYSDTCTESEFDACIDRAIANATERNK